MPKPQAKIGTMLDLLQKNPEATQADLAELEAATQPRRPPVIRASTLSERLRDKYYDLFESAARQPIGRIADALGVTDLAGIANERGTGGKLMMATAVPPPGAGTLATVAKEAQAARALTGGYRLPRQADLAGDSIFLWHGTTNDNASKILSSGQIKEGPRGRNATAFVTQALQFPEDTGAEALVLVRANPRTLTVDPNDQIGSSVKEGLFPRGRRGMGSSTTLGEHSVVDAFDISGASEAAVMELQAGNFSKALEMGVKQLSAGKVAKKAQAARAFDQ